MVDEAMVAISNSVIPEKDGEADKTNEPVPVTPVTSVIRLSSSAMVSSEVLEILLVKVVQSAEVKRPRLAAEALGIFSVAVSPSATGEADQLMSVPVLPVAKAMEELAKPALPSVPVSVGVYVMVLPAPVMSKPAVRPLNALVEVARVSVGPVWIEPAGPTPVILLLPPPIPRVEVATHRVLIPVVCRIMPREPAVPNES